jgi:hypothetical protein
MKKRWSLLAIIVVMVLILAIVVVIQPFFSYSSIVSHDELNGYFLTYLTEYAQLVEENMGLLNFGVIQGNSSSGSQNLTFYWQRPYQVQGVISSVHGAALILNRSNKEEFEVAYSDEAIEYYVWPSMAKNTTNLPSIRVLKATSYYVLDTQVTAGNAVMYIDPGANLIYTGQGHVFSFPEGIGAVIFFGTLMEGNRLILKGSNNVEDWSQLQARIDSLDRFLWDSEDILNETTLQSLKAKYTLPLLLERISARMNDGSYKGNPSLFTDDYGELQTIGAPTETLNRVLNDYYEMQSTKSPTIGEQLGSFFVTYLWPIVAAVITTVIGGIILYHWTGKQKVPKGMRALRAFFFRV